MRILLIVLGIAALGVGVWLFTRDGGVIQQVTQERVEGALLANGLPAPMAACMAEKLTDKLTIAQLQSLEKLGPQGGERRIPESRAEAMDRLRRVDDSEAVSALVGSATSCGLGMIGKQLNS
jgi:hypothetical protein